MLGTFGRSQGRPSLQIMDEQHDQVSHACGALDGVTLNLKNIHLEYEVKRTVFFKTANDNELLCIFAI